RLDFATGARPGGTRMPSTDDLRSFAGARSTRIDSKRIEIDSRYRARGWPVESGIGQCARSGGIENFVATNPEVESGITEITRSSDLRRRSSERRRQYRITGAAFAK